MKYYSQAGQDKWVHELIGDKGFFVDVGAYDGINTSNTYALEEVGWKGICIEGNRDYFKTLVENRKSVNICRVVSNDTQAENEYSAAIDTLDNILELCETPEQIDYMSMDIEGFELIALSCFDFARWNVKLFTIEHNVYSEGPERKNKIYDLLTKNGYVRVFEDVKCPDPNYLNQPFEDWYKKI